MDRSGLVMGRRILIIFSFLKICENGNPCSTLALLPGDPLLGGEYIYLICSSWELLGQTLFFSLQVAVDIFTVVLVGKLIEPLWGALEMMTFFFIINTGDDWWIVLNLNMTFDQYSPQHRQWSFYGQYSLPITGVAVLCAIFYYLLYMITENVDLLFQVQKLQ